MRRSSHLTPLVQGRRERPVVALAPSPTKDVRAALTRPGFAAAVTLWGFLQGVAAQYDGCSTGAVVDIGNGLCDAALNTPSCGYDGGDCCPCTCVDSADHSCSESVFDCLYPGCDDANATTSNEAATCVEEWQGYSSSSSSSSSSSMRSLVPPCILIDAMSRCLSFAAYSSYPFLPDPACFQSAVVAEFPDCTGDWIQVGDGECNPDTNVPSCGYDGGDCCPCSCSGSACAFGVFDCLDPDAKDEFYECEAPPPASRPCSAEVQREWLVDNPAQAKALTAAVNCSGGSFEVEWRGTIVVDEPIYVADGTTLTVSGVAGSLASIDGNSSTRLFTVVNAALHLGGLNVTHGSSTSGGAIAAAGSTLTFNRTNFMGNSASGGGGAVFVSGASSVSCSHGTTFVENRAGTSGGGMFASGGSVVSCGGSWFSNSAVGYGGALRMEHGSSVSWSEGSVFELNSAGLVGGALHAVNSSRVSWDAPTGFYYNSAGVYGGGLSLGAQSIASWQAETVFFSNNAGESGGAAAVASASNVSWSGDDNTVFNGNQAELLGGAFFIDLGSDVSWSGGANTTFSGNDAGQYGGAFLVTSSSHVSWSGAGKTLFDGNQAGQDGGVFSIVLGSDVSWSGDGNTVFYGNQAGQTGGAINTVSSHVSWSGDGSTFFDGNQAGQYGGALALRLGSEVSCTVDTTTTYSGNSALDGGAVWVVWGSLYLSDGTLVGSGGAVAVSSNSNVVWRGGMTQFIGNEAAFHGSALRGANGGGLSLLGACALEVDPGVEVSYIGNSAGVAGGAVFVSGAGTGPTFSSASFVSNSAQVGGAVSVFGSGNSKSVSEVVPPDPTTFDRCRFVGNRATTGGAIDSAAGHDSIVDSTFEDNAAGTGGAMRLAGTASIDSCSFVENFSEDGGGAVVSNIGTISGISNISFDGNGFSCPAGMFLHYNESGDPYEAVCDGCAIACEGCVFAEPLLAPICKEVMTHSTSSGGKTTLEDLSLERGYWRATNSSEVVLACYNEDACLGGQTGASEYCLEGYEGPYCAICSEGYTAQLGFVCSKCSSSTAGVALAVVLAVVALVAAVAVESYATTGAGDGGGRGWVDRVVRYIPLQSIKIVIVAWQILTQFTALASVTYPQSYQAFLDGLNVVNFDLSWVLSAGCIMDVDFHDRLLMSTIGPIVAVLFLGCTYAAAIRIHRGATETLQNVRHKHVSLVLLLTFFVYSSVSSVLFSTFACEVLEDGKNYLRSDYRIECDSARHRGFQVYAGFMIVVYTVGIPAFYAALLFKDRDILRQEKRDRGSASRVSSTSNLWQPYKPSVFYYEVIECARRILLAGVIVFIYPNSAPQIAISLMIAFAFVLISEGLAPYASRWDHWISRTGHVVVISSMYVALLLKVDVSSERSSSQKVFEGVLVAVHVVMVLVVLVETIVMGLALRAEHREDPRPRLRTSGKSISREKGGEVEGQRREVYNPFAAATATATTTAPTTCTPNGEEQIL
eukprot:g5717.t2